MKDIQFNTEEMGRIERARVLVSGGDFHLSQGAFIRRATLHAADEVLGVSHALSKSSLYREHEDAMRVVDAALVVGLRWQGSVERLGQAFVSLKEIEALRDTLAPFRGRLIDGTKS